MYVCILYYYLILLACCSIFINMYYTHISIYTDIDDIWIVYIYLLCFFNIDILYLSTLTFHDMTLKITVVTRCDHPSKSASYGKNL